MHRKQSFTLIELLVVIAILAILAVGVVLVINPVDLIKQSRDSNRLSDLNSLNKALALFDVTNPDDFTGTSSIVYVSLPVASEGTCPGLPTLPAGYTYKCVTSSTLALTNGTGWIPINFQNISYGSPIGKLPVDPINSSSSGQYYTYIMGGSWALSAKIESARYYYDKAFNDNGYDPDRLEIGSNLSLYKSIGSLTAHYFARPGSGLTALDYSGNGYDGTITIGTSTGWAADQNGVADQAYLFDGANTNIITTLTTTSSFQDGFSISAWIKPISMGEVNNGVIVDKSDGSLAQNGFFYSFVSNTTNGLALKVDAGVNGTTALQAITMNDWNFIAVTVTSSSDVANYVNAVRSGSIKTTGALSGVTSSVAMVIGVKAGGTGQVFNGTMADLRIYGRVLSQSDISSIYESTR